jgi:CheY-like chemotaxis protein
MSHPLAQHAVGPGATTPTASPAARPDAPLTVLSVEDNPMIAELVLAVLRRDDRFGEVAHAASVAQARAWLASNRADVLLLDHDLPDGTAEDVIQALPGAGGPPVVLFSAAPEVAARAAALGCADAVTKGSAEWQLLPERLAHAAARSTNQLIAAMSDAIRADNAAVLALHALTLAVLEGPGEERPSPQWQAQVEQCSRSAQAAVAEHARTLEAVAARQGAAGACARSPGAEP